MLILLSFGLSLFLNWFQGSFHHGIPKPPTMALKYINTTLTQRISNTFLLAGTEEYRKRTQKSKSLWSTETVHVLVPFLFFF